VLKTTTNFASHVSAFKS